MIQQGNLTWRNRSYRCQQLGVASYAINHTVREQRPLLAGYSGDNNSAPVHMMSESGQSDIRGSKTKIRCSIDVY